MYLNQIILLQEGTLVVKLLKPKETTKAGIIKSAGVLKEEHKSEYNGFEVVHISPEIKTITVGDKVLLESYEQGLQFIVEDFDNIVIDGKLMANVMLVYISNIFGKLKPQNTIEI